MLGEAFENRVLPFDSAPARVYANIAAKHHSPDRPVARADSQPAAIARSRRMAVVTRNVPDFEDVGIEVVDPMIVTVDRISIPMPMRDTPARHAWRHYYLGHLRRHATTPADVPNALAELTVYDPGFCWRATARPSRRGVHYSGRQVVAVPTTHTRPPAARPPVASDTSTDPSFASCTPMTRFLDTIPAPISFRDRSA